MLGIFCLVIVHMCHKIYVLIRVCSKKRKPDSVRAERIIIPISLKIGSLDTFNTLPRSSRVNRARHCSQVSTVGYA